MSADGSPPALGGDDALRQVITILNKRGLHARASAKFVKCAEQFNAEVLVSREGLSVSGTSIMGLMMLAAHPGTEITVDVTGDQAREALMALIDLIKAKFHED